MCSARSPRLLPSAIATGTTRSVTEPARGHDRTAPAAASRRRPSRSSRPATACSKKRRCSRISPSITLSMPRTRAFRPPRHNFGSPLLEESSWYRARLRASTARKSLRLGACDDRLRTRRCGYPAKILDCRTKPRDVRVFPADDILVGVVEIQVADMVRDRLVPQQQCCALRRRTPGERQAFRRLHAFCFSLQVMHTRVHGIAFSRASAIGSPQSRQTP